MNWSGNFREGLAREIRENKTLAKITAYTVMYNFVILELIGQPHFDLKSKITVKMYEINA